MTENTIMTSKLQMGFGYMKWIRDLTRISAEKGLSSYYGFEGFTKIRSPYISGELLEKFDTPGEKISNDEVRQYQNYVKINKEYEDNCARALALIRQSISHDLQQSVERAVPYPENPRLETIENVLHHLRKTCGGVWSSVAEQISYNALNACPDFHTIKDFDTAMDMLKNLVAERGAWSEPLKKATVSLMDFEVDFDMNTQETVFKGSPPDSIAGSFDRAGSLVSGSSESADGLKEAGGGGKEEEQRISAVIASHTSVRRPSRPSRPAVERRGEDRFKFPDSTLLLWLTDRLLVRTDMKELLGKLDDPEMTFVEALPLVTLRFDVLRRQQQRELLRVASNTQAMKQTAPRQAESQELAFAAKQPTHLPEREKRCFGCQQLGHVIRDCPNGAAIPPSTVVKIRCTRCQGIGHYSQQCPTPYTVRTVDPDRGTGKTSTYREDSNIRSTKKLQNPFVVVRAGNKRKRIDRSLLSTYQEAAANRRNKVDMIAQKCVDEDAELDDEEEYSLGSDNEDALGEEDMDF